MALADIRAAVTAAVQSVPNVGVVTDFEPYATREEEFNAYFLDEASQSVLGWTVTREKTDEALIDLETVRAEHSIVIRGYRGLGSEGATEKAFQDLIETIRTRLRQERNPRFGGIAARVGMPQVRTVEARRRGDVLVHYCEIVLAIQEQFPIPEV